MTATAPVPDKHLPKTSWTLLSRMRGEEADAELAREEFARRYYVPIHAYMRALRAVRHLDVDAEDLTQGFFADVIVGGQLLNRYRRARGGFRPYLKQALRNYAGSLGRAGTRKKRRANGELRPDQWSAGWEGLALEVVSAPEVAFHEAFVRTVIREALERVEKVCGSRGLVEHFAIFAARYLDESSRPAPWAELGAKFGLDEKQARSRAETVQYQFRIVLRELIKEEVGSEHATDEEIATLLSLF